MPRFVVLEHHWNGIHWDLMLETGSTLRTWALESAPDASHAIAARQSADHRFLYLDYEGEVSGGRGHVKRWDSGTFEWLEQSDGMRLRLNGRRLRGCAVLRPAATDAWLFAWETESPPSL